jgi:catechol 2,3-dioxygenase-like lactoylglutathione lyase family enzyme
MFDHVTLRVADRAAGERFYTTVLGTLGVEQTYSGREFAEWDDLSLAQADAGHPPTRHLHVGIAARSRELAEAFWEAGRAAGYRDAGAPGPRPQYRHDYFGAFLLDPDGNSIEAVHHGAMRRPGTIDHLWIRVADLERAAAFYATIAPHAGFERGDDGPDRRQFRAAAGAGSFSLVDDGAPRTAGLHLAFPGDRDAVEGFHRAATAAGYADNGAPGERPHYHPGYYAAFVLDPDGHNVEVVDHAGR